MMVKKNFLLIILLMIILSGILSAQAVRESVQADLILKIIKLDRNFNRFGDPIKIGVTSKSMEKALKDNPNQIVKSRSIQVEELKTLDDIPNYNILYIDTNWKKDYEIVSSKAIEKKILMFCNSYKAVEKGIGGISFRVLRRQPKIVVNLDVIKQQGSNFPAEFLKLTEIVKK